jgi:UDP-glucose 4-epimerase
MLLSTGRTALVWGARGFIGSHLVADLLARAYQVVVLSRGVAATAPAWSEAVRWITLDTDRREWSFDAALDGTSVVFNLAGSSGAVASNKDPLASLDSTCRLQLEFLRACERAAAPPHVVFASSRLVYAHAGDEAVTEEYPVTPLSVYAAHKLCVEHYHRILAQRAAITFTICRISNPYGLDQGADGKGYGFINAMIHRALAGRPLTLFGRGLQLRDYLYIDDLVTMLRRCAERDEARNEVFNVGRGLSLPLRDAIESVQRTLGGGPIEYLPWPRDHEAVESGDFVVDVRKARALLAFEAAYTFDAGLAAVRARAVGAAMPSPARETAPVAISSRG